MKSTLCRSCGSSNLVLVYDFGAQPLAGVFPTVPESERPALRVPLDLTQCATCGLLQVTNLPPIEAVFHEDYRYSSSTVPDLIRHFEGYADWLCERIDLQLPVLEFGCNDGVLLGQLAKRGLACIGVDASANMAQLARDKGLDVRTGFLAPELIETEGLTGRFGLVTCSNVFAHIDDLATTLAAVRLALAPRGLFAIEVHDGRILAEEAQFDTIYHEHLTYFTAETLSGLVARYGFECESIEQTSMHGGGLRLLARRKDAPDAMFDYGAPAMVDGAVFAASVRRCEADLVRLFEQYGPLDGYGAAGRSQMFINITRTDKLFAKIVDDSPFRQNRFVVGTDIPIVAFEQGRGRCCVILAWNYAASISAKTHDLYERVVTLLPERRDW